MAKTKGASQSAEFMRGLARLLNKVGPDDPQVDEYIEAHKADRTFAKTAPLARTLKRALMPQKKKGKR